MTYVALLLLQNKDCALKEISKESLIRLLLWKRLGEHLVFSLKMKCKSHKPWRNFPVWFSSGLAGSSWRTESWKKTGIRKTCCDPDRNSSAKRNCRSKIACNKSPKPLTMPMSLISSAGPNISKGRRWMENSISVWNRSVTTECGCKKCVWTGLRYQQQSADVLQKKGTGDEF